MQFGAAFYFWKIRLGWSYLECGVGGEEGDVSDGDLAGAGAELVPGHEAVHPAQHLRQLVRLVLARLVAAEHHGVNHVPECLHAILNCHQSIHTEQFLNVKLGKPSKKVLHLSNPLDNPPMVS